MEFFGILTDKVEHSSKNRRLKELTVVVDKQFDQNIVISENLVEKIDIMQVLLANWQLFNNIQNLNKVYLVVSL